MKKGFVYKIELDNEIYIGSTEQKLCDRQKNHNYDLKRQPNRKLYKKCIEQGITEIKLIWVADIEFNHTAEKRMIEEKYRKELNGTLNSIRCYITEEEEKERDKQKKKEYRETHKEEIKQHKKEYYETHKEEIAKKTKEYRETHKEEIAEKNKEYYENNKEEIAQKKKEHYETNKEKISQKQKEYREKHKEAIAEKKRQKVICEICNESITKDNLARHQKSKKCMECKKE